MARIVAHLIKKPEKPVTVSTSTKESSFEKVNLFEVKTEKKRKKRNEPIEG